MARRFPTNFPQRLSVRTPSKSFDAEASSNGGVVVEEFTAPVAALATGILNGTSIATAVDTTSFAGTYLSTSLGPWGRNITVVASGAATSNVTVYGRDYLGQKMIESFTLNGTTPVTGNKIFRYVDRVTAGVTAATTINLGWGTRMGMRYKVLAVQAELLNSAVASAGTVVAGVDTTQTATTADPRGSWSPASAADGSKNYTFAYMTDLTNLEGVAHFGG